MSTSDAGGAAAEQRRLRAATPALGTTPPAPTEAARAQQDEKDGERFQQQSHESSPHQVHHQSILRQYRSQKELTPGATRNVTEVHYRRLRAPRYTSCLFLEFSKNRSIGSSNQRLKSKPDSCPGSSTEPPRAGTEHTCSQVAADNPQFHRKEDIITARHSELENTAHLNVKRTLSNGDFGGHERNGSHIFPYEAQTRRTFVELRENIRDNLKPDNHNKLGVSNPSKTMLSSTMVSVLAPHWSGRIRRSKRYEEPGDSEPHGAFQDMTNISGNQGQNQRGPERLVTAGPQAQQRAAFMGTRRNTVDWSCNSDSVRLDRDPKRKVIQTVPLEVNSGRMDNRNLNPGPLSPVSTNTSLHSSSSLVNLKEQPKNPQSRSQEVHTTMSSKPTTSSLLLSLRRMNSSGRNSNLASSFSEESKTPRDQQGHLPMAPHFQNNNDKERAKSVSAASTGPVMSPSPRNYKEGNMTEPNVFSASLLKKDTVDKSSIQQRQECSRHVSLSGEPSVRQQNSSGLDKTPHIYPERSVSSLRHSPYDPSALLKSHALPRRTTLTTTSWWKQVTQEGISPLTPNSPPNVKDQETTPFFDLSVPAPADNRFRSQIPQNAGNNNKDESVCTGNMKLLKETQGGTLKQRNDWDSPVQSIDRLSKQYDSSMNNREPQKPHNIDNVTSRFKISSDTAQTTLSHPKDFCKNAVSNGLSTVTAAESHPTLQNISPATPTQSSSKYTGNQCPSKTNTGLKSSHIYSDMYPKHSISSNFSLSDQTTAPAPKPTPLFLSHQVSSQANIHTSTSTGSSSQMSKFTHTTNATPLGFERSYASFPNKPLPSKTMSSLIHTAGPSSKPNYSAAPTVNRPTITTVPSLSLFTPPVTPVFSTSTTTTTLSSFPTPPATPVNKSPSCLKSSSPKEGTMFSDSPDGDSKSRSEKKARRVTWDDSVDIQSPSEPIITEKPDSVNPVSSSPLSASSSPRNVRAPSIFNFLRSSSETTNTAPLCSPVPKTTSIQVEKGGKFRSMSSDCADSIAKEQEGWKRESSERKISDPIRQDLAANRRERKPSFESDAVQCHSSTSFSLPPDFSSGYRLRYSSPPYSTLMSSRSTQGEPKTKAVRSPLLTQSPQSTYPLELSLQANPSPPTVMPSSKPPEFPLSPPQTFSLPPQNQTSTQQSSKFLISETDPPKNQSMIITPNLHSGQVLLVNNRVDVSSAGSRGDKADNSSTCVTETLVYSIKTKANTATAVPKDTTPKPEKHTANTEVSLENRLGQQSHPSEIKEVSDEPRSYSNQSSSSAGSQSQGDESCNKVMKDSLLSRSRFFSVESNNEQTSPKRSRFTLKKSVSTPNSGLSRSDSEKTSKGNKKMDQVLNKLRQTFSPKRSDDDLLFPWKSKRPSQTPSLSGSSDISSVSDVPSDSTKMLEEQTQKGKAVVKDKAKGGESLNKYIIVPPPGGDKFSVWTEKTTDTDQDTKNNCPGHKSESGGPVHAIESSPTIYQCDLYKDNKTDNKCSNLFPTSRDPSPNRITSPSGGYATQFRKSTSSPKSPFSPFSSLAPVSPFPSPEATDDNVFYSPKLQRRRNSPSPCEPGEGLSLGTSRSRASTGPPTVGAGPDMEHLSSSYADLKYGIVPGRSFSVSSVLSSRPSGPGRISTGARVMSVGDLPKSSLTRASNIDDWDERCFASDWSSGNNGQPSNKFGSSGFPCNSGKIRSRSLPRSLTKCLANWNSDVFDPYLAPIPPLKPDAHCSSNVNICHFDWDAEGPPTPPPTPPLSPVSRRMSTAPSRSSPTFPSPPGAPQSLESQPSRGHLPSRGYVSSLSTFEESSDSCSDTTTDDEYYLETGDGDDKETEL